MAEQTFNDFFAGQRMTLLAEAAAVKLTIPRVLSDAFYQPGPTKPYSDQVQYPSVTWSRSGATVVARNSPPRAINLGQTDWKFATLLNMKEEMELQPDFLMSLFSDFPMIRDNAMQELNRRMIAFNRRADITRINMVHSLFSNKKIWVGSDGQILASSSGAVITLDPSVPTGNGITKDGSGSTYNIGDWSSASTDIQGNLRALQESNLRTNGFMLTNILYGTSLPTYIAANTAAQPYLSRNPNFREYLVAQNEIPQGLFGFNWIPARLAYSVSAAGTATATFATNFLGAFPDPSPDWYEFVEGGTLVPNGVAGATDVNPSASMQDMLGRFRIANGKYSYGVVKSYPVVGQSMVQGDVAGPVLKVPGTFYAGTCS